jgi:hypothetical protein
MMRLTTTSVARLLVICLAAGCGGESNVLAPDTIPASITLSSPPGTLAVGTNIKLTATIIGSDGKPLSSGVTWTTSDRLIADVQSDGTVSAIGAGVATITAVSSVKPSISASALISVVPIVPASYVKLVGDSTYSLMSTQTSGYFVEQSVRLLDAANKPLPNVSVTFTVVPNTGTLGTGGTLTVLSDANGVATVPAGTWNARLVANTESTLLFAAAGQPTAGSFTLFRVGNSFGYSSCELTRAGAAYCAGYNANGTVGDGTNVDRATFVPVSGGMWFASLADGVANHHCALTADGQAYCWGQNSMGELGDGTLTDRNVPVQVLGGLSFSRIYTELSTTCGITTSGATYCWGFTGTGGWGGGNSQRAKRYLVPTPVVTGGLTFRSLALMDDGICGITSAGVIACLGRGYQGSNADGTTTQRITFTSWPGTWADVAAGNMNVCALNPAGLVFCVGSNQGGALGAATGTSADYKLVPTQIASTLSFKSIFVGNLRACAVTSAEDVYCWGFHPGNGMPTSDRPVKIPGLTTNALRIGSFRNACAVVGNGELYCWGGNTNPLAGTVGDGTGVERFSPTAVKGWPDGPPAGTPTSIALLTLPAISFRDGPSAPQLPSVVVNDRFGTPVSGATVTFAPVGAGTVTGGTRTTDANGVATVGSWSVMTNPGSVSLEISVAGVPPVVVQAVDLP